MKTGILGIYIGYVLLLSDPYPASAQKDIALYETGKSHFRTHCSSCHSAHQEIYGPMLGSISKKKEERWLIAFIQNSQNVIKSGDVYAQNLFEKFNNQIMPSFEQLSEKDIRAILYYLELESTHPSKHINDSSIPSAKSNTVIKGKQEFLEHCSSCHFIHEESTYAPALGSVTKRHSRDWLISFIKHSQNKIQGGDAYAQFLFKKFDQHVMTKMVFLPIEDIHAILDYIEYASTVDASYKGKINNIEYKRQALIQIKEVSSSYTVISFIYLILLLIALFSALFVLMALRSLFRYQTDSVSTIY